MPFILKYSHVIHQPLADLEGVAWQQHLALAELLDVVRARNMHARRLREFYHHFIRVHIEAARVRVLGQMLAEHRQRAHVLGLTPAGVLRSSGRVSNVVLRRDVEKEIHLLLKKGLQLSLPVIVHG